LMFYLCARPSAERCWMRGGLFAAKLHHLCALPFTPCVLASRFKEWTDVA
jgi:hypothetical protein